MVETSVNKLLKEGHAESPNSFAIKSRINNLLKVATNLMVMYLILLIIKKYKTKVTFAFILKESYFIFKVKEFGC